MKVNREYFVEVIRKFSEGIDEYLHDDEHVDIEQGRIHFSNIEYPYEHLSEIQKPETKPHNHIRGDSSARFRNT